MKDVVTAPKNHRRKVRNKALNLIIPNEAILLVAVLWAVFIIDLVLPGITFNHFGILPRKIEGLTGIFASPFLHGGLSHIISNSIPLIILSALVRISIGSKQMLVVMFIGVVGSGIGTWLFSSGDLVIGASGLVFSLIGFLLADAYFSPSLRSWTVAILSFVLYGGTLLSLFDFLPFVSWAAHFWGLVSGIAIASLLRSPRQNKPPLRFY
jgi:membrane associated rhomboid family serine protease